MGSTYSHETYESVNPDISDGYHYSARFESNYFSEGVSRYAFKGTLNGQGRRNGNACVVKAFKESYAKRFIDWAPDIAASKKAKGYAEEFVRGYYPRIRNYIPAGHIEFIIPLVARMQQLSSFYIFWLIPTGGDDRFVQLNEYIAIEPYLEGFYEKFNSNGGWEGYNELVNAFCHWTWVKSGHRYMVCDLQGVKSENNYVLTDPAIHSADQEFGPTDLVLLGMVRVLGNHQCNNLCRVLGLNNPVLGVNINPGPRSTTYSFQVTEQEMMRANRIAIDHRLGVIQEY